MGFELQSFVVVLCCFDGSYLIHEESETQRLNDLPKREEKVIDPFGVSLSDSGWLRIFQDLSVASYTSYTLWAKGLKRSTGQETVVCAG